MKFAKLTIRMILLPAVEGISQLYLMALLGLIFAAFMAWAAPASADVMDDDCGWADMTPDYAGDNAPDVMLFGELHGTVEGPQAVGDIACRFAMEGKRVIVLLEMPSTHAQVIGSLGPADDAREQLCSNMGNFWENAADGRRSIAIASLILRMNRLKSRFGDRIQIESSSIGPEMQRPDGVGFVSWIRSHMANNIVRHAEAYDVVLVNIGNAHPPALRSAIIEAAGDEPLDVLNVIQIHEAGTSWNCQQGSCASHETAPSWRYPPDMSLSRFPVLRPVEGVSGYEAAMFIGPITASAPVADTPFCESAPLAAP